MKSLSSYLSTVIVSVCRPLPRRKIGLHISFIPRPFDLSLPLKAFTFLLYVSPHSFDDLSILHLCGSGGILDFLEHAMLIHFAVKNTKNFFAPVVMTSCIIIVFIVIDLRIIVILACDKTLVRMYYDVRSRSHLRANQQNS